MAKEWRNWAGDQRCTPAAIERPRSRAELVELVDQAANRAQTIRVAGAGHSFTDIACTDGLMLQLDRLNRIIDVDRDSGLVKVEGGIGLRDMNERLHQHGRAMENLGDIDKQSAAGAVSTATHGTGSRFRNISSQIEAIEIITGNGELVEIDGSDSDALNAARVGLGALGVIATITFRTAPAFTIRRVDSPLALEETLGRLDELADGSDHFEFYVFPHTKVALTRRSERTGDPPRPRGRMREYAQEIVLENYVISLISRLGRRSPKRIPALTRFVARRIGSSEKIDRSYRVFASQRRVRFTEMEYAIPRENGEEAIRRVLEVAERPELQVGFPVEVRFVAGDDAHLSTAHGRDTCYIAVHMFRGMAWEEYFRAVEAIMADYDGRPHWGKRHLQSAETLARLYPRWADFQRVRARLDRDGRFRNDYTDRVLGSPS
jgi:FAD-linked oxidoreductase